MTFLLITVSLFLIISLAGVVVMIQDNANRIAHKEYNKK